jgi:hypothetical protein
MTRVLLAALLAALLVPAVAAASTYTVDDDKQQCPNAGFTTIQSAINQAAPWDTVAICEGVYAEVSNATNATNSPAQTGAKNGLTITKPLTIRGAGASKVIIKPAASAAPSLAGTSPYLRDGGGAVIQINRQAGGSSDFTENFVDISGVTVTSPDVYAEAGVAFFNTSGRVSKSVIGPLYRSADATELAAKPHGWGVVMTNSLQGASEAAVRREVTVADSLVTGYQSGGILFDDARGTDGNASNTLRSGIIEYGTVAGTRVAGGGPSTVIPQTGVRYHAGARGAVTGSEITGNSYTPDPRRSVGVLLTDANTGTDASNPPARAFSATGNAFSENGYGLFNADITNASVRQGAPALATGPSASDENWWGCASGPLAGPPGAGGCEGVSGPDTTPAPSVELGPARTSAPGALSVPAAITDAPPAGAFVDPGEGTPVPTGTTIEPVVLTADDFGVKSVSLTADGAPVATMGAAPYQFSWTATDADIGKTVALAATITDSSGQATVETVHVKVPVPDGYRAIGVTPLSADFGTVAQGRSAGRPITISNPGRNPLKLTSLGLAGPGYFVYDPATTCAAGTTLAVGEECSIMPAFAPVRSGTAGGSLTIAYSAPGGGAPVVVPLSGAGAPLGAPASRISRGTLKPDTQRTVSVKLACVGRAACSGTLTIRTAALVGPKGKQRIVKLAYVKFGPIKAGTSATVSVPLRPSALALIAPLEKVKIKVVASLSDSSGPVSPLRTTKTLKLKT